MRASSFFGARAGFTLTELLITIGIFATLAAMAMPVYSDLAENSRLNSAAREVERELQSARLKAVGTNRTLRVAFNCPVAGQFRTLEVLGTATDNQLNRCTDVAFPYPPADQDPFTRPNHDGPMRRLTLQTTVTTQVVEFRPNGTALQVVGGAAQAIVGDLAVTVTRRGRSRTVTVNAMGKVTLP
jgi:prepilin-type N-terminal cleavage/methylation domain-containing protein